MPNFYFTSFIGSLAKLTVFWVKIKETLQILRKHLSLIQDILIKNNF